MSEPGQMWFWVSLPYATFCVAAEINPDVNDGEWTITQAPPIARWMVGRREDECEEWVHGRRGGSWMEMR